MKRPSTFLPIILTISLGSILLASCSLNSPDPCFELSCESLKQMDKILAGEEVLLRNCSDNGLTYSWDFGDDSTSTAKSPRHSWEKAGNYTITLSVENEDAEKSITEDITVSPSMYGTWVGSYNNGDRDVKITFIMVQSALKIKGVFNSDGIISTNSNISENEVTLNCVEYFEQRGRTFTRVYKFTGTVNDDLSVINGETVTRNDQSYESWHARKQQ